MLRTVVFSFDVGDRVKDPFEQLGMVQELNFGMIGGESYYVRYAGERTSEWWNAGDLKPLLAQAVNPELPLVDGSTDGENATAEVPGPAMEDPGDPTPGL